MINKLYFKSFNKKDSNLNLLKIYAKNRDSKMLFLRTNDCLNLIYKTIILKDNIVLDFNNRTISQKYLKLNLSFNVHNYIFDFLYNQLYILKNKITESNIYKFQQNLINFKNLTDYISLINIKTRVCLQDINSDNRRLNKQNCVIMQETIEEQINVPVITKIAQIIKKPLVIKNYKKNLRLRRHCILRRTRNNTFITVTNALGEVVIRQSAGLVKIKSKKKKRAKETYQLMLINLATQCFNNKIKLLDKIILKNNIFKGLIYKLLKTFKTLGLILKIKSAERIRIIKDKELYNHYKKKN